MGERRTPDGKARASASAMGQQVERTLKLEPCRGEAACMEDGGEAALACLCQVPIKVGRRLSGIHMCSLFNGRYQKPPAWTLLGSSGRPAWGSTAQRRSNYMFITVPFLKCCKIYKPFERRECVWY